MTMKQTNNLVLALAVFIGLLLPALAPALLHGPEPTAYAAAAKCYYDPSTWDKDGTKGLADCSKFPAHTFNNDKCYDLVARSVGISTKEVACSSRPEFGAANASTPGAPSASAPGPNSPTGGRIELKADCKPPPGTSLDKSNCGIIGYIVTFTRVLSAIVGVVIVIMIAVGGLQFSMARDDPQAVAAAKNRIRNAVFALLAYLFGFAFLQWLVPGGIF